MTVRGLGTDLATKGVGLLFANSVNERRTKNEHIINERTKYEHS